MTTDRVDLVLVKWSSSTSEKDQLSDQQYDAIYILQETASTQRFTSVKMNVIWKLRQSTTLIIQDVLDLSIRRILNEETIENACLDLQESTQIKIFVSNCEAESARRG